MARRGKFITFEGLDGCGKTTQLKKLAASLRRQGIRVVTTREPGGTPIGEKIRSVLLDSRTAGMAPLAELALMFGARAQHIQQVILPAVKAGQWVLCDRFTDSSEAYQGGGRQLGSATILTLHRTLCDDLQPDLTLLLLSDPKKSVERARGRNQRNQHIADEGRFELETTAFFHRVSRAYLALAKREAKRIVAVESGRSIPEVQKAVWAAVEARLLKKGGR
ncbi:MAG TPA: dTMP kinase [Terriglobales bacterium]|nr:dTMP kinase [Terriglobales bacterium]